MPSYKVFLLIIGVLLTSNSYAFRFESDRVVLFNTAITPAFVTVNFRQTYSTVPMVFALPTNQGGEPSALRIRNITTSSFEITQVEPTGNNGTHTSMTVDYIAIEPGVHTLPDGTLIEVGSTATTTVQHGIGVPGAEGWDTINFAASFTGTPAVIAHIQDMANESSTPPSTPPVPWLTTAIRNVTNTNMQIALERSEVADGGTVTLNEAVAYIAIQGGSLGNFIDNGGATVNYEAIFSADIIRGWNDGCHNINFAGAYAANPLVVASQTRHDGGDGGWIRRCNLTTAIVGLTVDEDIFRDAERNHTTENAGIIVFSQAFDADFSLTPRAEWRMDEPSWSGTANEINDSSGNAYHGTANNSTTTAGVLCNAADLSTNSNNDFLNMNNGAMNSLTNFTVTFWGNTGNVGNMAGLSGARAGQANEALFWFPNSTTAAPFLSGTAVGNVGISNIADSNWHHFAWTRAGNTHCIYMDGSLRGCVSGGSAGAITIDVNGLIIGQEQDAVGGGFDINQDWEGLIDEFIVFDRPLGLTEIQTIRTNHLAGNNIDGTPRVCIVVDHFDINHDGQAVNCQAESITIEAHLADHSISTLYTGTLNLSTSTGRGDWTVITGTSPINNSIANDGIATYDLVAADNGVVELGLKDTTVETLNINVTDGSISETSGTALASEDANLAYAQSGFQFLADGVASSIGNQIGGKNSATSPGNQVLELQAIRTSDSTGQCEPALQGVVVVEMAYECENPTTCTANQVNIDGGTATNIAGNPLGPIGAWTNVNMDFGNAADTTATFVMNYPDVGQIQLHTRYNIPLDDAIPTPSGIYMIGSSNSFVVRPFGFYVDITGNPAAGNPAGAVFTTAGTNFTTNVTAVLWQAADDADTNGIPENHNDTDPSNNANLSDNTAALNYGQETAVEAVALSALLDQPGGGNDPGLAGGTSIAAFVSGVGSSATTRYDEVGIIEIAATVSDGNYLGIGGPVTTETTSRSGYVGRFRPNHFLLSLGAITNRSLLACAPPSIFTYMDEEQQLEFTLIAENSRAPAATTQNYTTASAFAKLDPTLIANFNIGAIDATGPTPLTPRITEVSSAASSPWAIGVSNGFARVRLNRDALMANNGPFETLNWGVAPLDTDGVILNAYNLDVDNNATNDHGLVASNRARFGRAFVESTSGSELLSLILPVRVEYYAGTQFILNTDDGCSTYDSVDLTFSNRIGLPADPTPVGNGTFITGMHDPANPITLNSSNNVGNVDATLNVPTYLEFDWDGDGNHDDDPTGKATFGIFDVNPRRIYIKEVY